MRQTHAHSTTPAHWPAPALLDNNERIETLIAARQQALDDARNAHAAAADAVSAIKRAHESFANASGESWSFNGPSYNGGRNPAMIDARCAVDARQFMVEATRALDAALWNEIDVQSGRAALMEAEALEAQRQTNAEKPATVTEEAVRARIEATERDRETLLRRGIAAAFVQLDARFASHEGFRPGTRITLEHMFDHYGTWSHGDKRRRILADVERMLRLIDRDRVWTSIVDKLDETRRRWSMAIEPCTVESTYARVRIFKNGNAHLWLLEQHLIGRVNAALKVHYEQSGAIDGTARANDPRWIADRLGDAAQIGRRDPPMRVLIAGRDCAELAREAARRGARTECVALEVEEANRCRSIDGVDRVRTGTLSDVLRPLERYDRVLLIGAFDTEHDAREARRAIETLDSRGRAACAISAHVEHARSSEAGQLRTVLKAHHAEWRTHLDGRFESDGEPTPAVMLIANGEGAARDSHFY